MWPTKYYKDYFCRMFSVKIFTHIFPVSLLKHSLLQIRNLCLELQQNYCYMGGKVWIYRTMRSFKKNHTVKENEEDWANQQRHFCSYWLHLLLPKHKQSHLCNQKFQYQHCDYLWTFVDCQKLFYCLIRLLGTSLIIGMCYNGSIISLSFL